MLAYAPSNGLLVNGRSQHELDRAVSMHSLRKPQRVVDLASDKCFLTLLSVLLSMAVINIALTVYIINTLQIGQVVAHKRFVRRCTPICTLICNLQLRFMIHL